MGAVKYWFSGGQRRWFSRQVRLLPASLSRAAAQGKDLEASGLLFEVLLVGLQIAPERALDLLLTCDSYVANACSATPFHPNGQNLLARAAMVRSGPGWRIGWVIARHLKAPAHLQTFGHNLALHWCPRRGCRRADPPSGSLSWPELAQSRFAR